MEMERYLKKQLFWMRLCAFACVGLCLFGVFAVLTVLPKAGETLDAINNISTQLSSVNWVDLAENIDALAKTGQESIANFDMQSLNQAIEDLQKIIAPLAKMFG